MAGLGFAAGSVSADSAPPPAYISVELGIATPQPVESFGTMAVGKPYPISQITGALPSNSSKSKPYKAPISTNETEAGTFSPPPDHPSLPSVSNFDGSVMRCNGEENAP